jgi:hypothetical protein
LIDYPPGLPCWAPGAADYLESILTGEENAVEWGGGASTVWLATKVKRILVIEHDPKWVVWIEDRVSSDVVTVACYPYKSKGYIEAVAIVCLMSTCYKTDKINLWLIDGYRRIDCLALVEKQVRPGDIVVLDDALDYAEHLLDGPWKIKRFAQPHPHTGIPINHKKYGHLRNTVRKVHADTKETWVCLTA